MLKIVKAKIKDQTELIKSTLFGDSIDKVKEGKMYLMMYLRVGKFNNVQYLKTIESTAFTPNDGIKAAVMESEFR